MFNRLKSLNTPLFYFLNKPFYGMNDFAEQTILLNKNFIEWTFSWKKKFKVLYMTENNQKWVVIERWTNKMMSSLTRPSWILTTSCLV